MTFTVWGNSKHLTQHSSFVLSTDGIFHEMHGGIPGLRSYYVHVHSVANNTFHDD